MKKYIALVLLKTTNRKTAKVLYDETMLSISATDLESAKLLASEYGKSSQHIYFNSKKEPLHVAFVQVIDVNDVLYEENSNITALYTRHFTDIKAYAKFEKLYKNL